MKKNRKPVNISIDEFKKHWEKGLSDIELAEIFDCAISTLAKYRRSFNLPANVKRYGKATLIDREILTSLVFEGFSNSEIAKKLKVTPLSVKNAKKRFGLEDTDERINKKITLSKKQKEVLFGTLLGDGYAQIQSRHCCITIQHSKKQKDYLDYLLKYFENIPKTISEYSRKDIRTNKTYEIYSVRLNTNECFDEFRKIFYDDKKHIPLDKLEEYYTPLSMAIHYFDDGWNEGNAAIFATCSFTKEELHIFRKFLFNKYDLETTLSKDNRIRIRACSYDRFIELIKPYTPECMKYKIEKVVS